MKLCPQSHVLDAIVRLKTFAQSFDGNGTACVLFLPPELASLPHHCVGRVQGVTIKRPAWICLSLLACDLDLIVMNGIPARSEFGNALTRGLFDRPPTNESLPPSILLQLPFALGSCLVYMDTRGLKGDFKWSKW